jgi:hypothetical protein
MKTTFVVLAVALAGVATAQYHAQCSAPYKSFTTYTRNTNFNDGNGNIEACDAGAAGIVNSGPASSNDWQGAGWYRFTGAAGTEMPTSPAGDYACGGDASAYLAGVHPAAADGVVSREVCFGFFHRPCAWTATINVVACNGFYLYNLVTPPALCLRYCGTTPASLTAEVGTGSASAKVGTGSASASSSGSSFGTMPVIFIVLGVLALVGVVVGVVFVRRQTAAAATAAAKAAAAGLPEPEWDDTLYVSAPQAAEPVAQRAAEVDMDAAVAQFSAFSRSSDV